MGLNKFIIIGTTPFSAVIRNIIVAEGGDVIAYSTSRSFATEDTFDGLPIIYTEDILAKKVDADLSYINTIGYSKMNTIREKVHNQLKSMNLPIASYISKQSLVYTNKIGEGCIIMPGAFVGPDVEIGDSNIIYANTSITHHIKLGNYNFIGSGCIIGGNVSIGNNCFLGLNSTIKNRCSIDDYTLLGSGANLTKSTNGLGGVFVGNPAKKIDGRYSFDTIV